MPVNNMEFRNDDNIAVISHSLCPFVLRIDPIHTARAFKLKMNCVALMKCKSTIKLHTCVVRSAGNL